MDLTPFLLCLLFTFTFGLNAKFLNLSPKKIYLFWEPLNGGAPKIMGTFKPDGGVTSFQTYVTHKFFWSRTEENPKPVKRFVIKPNQLIYTFATANTKPHLVEALKKERRFLKSYEKRTGRKWLAHYPRPAPIFHIWNATRIGQRFKIPLDPDARHWDCEEEGCQREETEFVWVETALLEPRAYYVDGFLSDFESEYLIETAKPTMKRSGVGSGENTRIDPVRSSLSSWLRRDQSKILNSIYHRLANVVNMPPQSVDHKYAAELMNILRYEGGQEYTPHYDWGSHGSHESRFISALIYMKEPSKGGATGFPLANDRQGVSIPAKQNRMTFFYDLLFDGNVDEFSLHAGEPVKEGIKWCAPMWLWDPHLSQGKSSERILKKYETEYQRRLKIAVAHEEEGIETVSSGDEMEIDDFFDYDLDDEKYEL